MKRGDKHNQVALWLADLWDCLRYLKYNWRSDLRIWWYEHRTKRYKRLTRKLENEMKKEQRR
jgi:hypothetical protein